MHSFQDKVVVITGAGSGIGRALAVELAGEKARLAINDINPESLRETAKLLEKLGAMYSIHVADISDIDKVQEFAAEVIKFHGDVDVLINNAGIALGRLDIGEISEDQWGRMMSVNFGGPLNCTRAFLPSLKKSHEAHIVNLSSIFGVAALKQRAGYCASKYAINGLTESLRQELRGSKINVSLVMPGGISTNLTANATGWKDKADQKVAGKMQSDSKTSPEAAARVILKGIKKKKYRIIIGKDAKILDLLTRFFPSYYGNVLNYFVSRAERKAHAESSN